MQSGDRFDKFTGRARRVLQFAQEEAQQLHNNYIGTEHLWLGIMREGEGVGAKVLESQGVTLQNMHNAVIALQHGSQPSSQGHLGLTETARKAIEQSVDEARRLNHHYIGSEHLLLGLVRQADKTTQEIFASLGVKLENLSSQTMKILTQAGAIQQRPPVSTQERERFIRFSTQSRKVLSLAQEEAQRFQHNYIGTEHLLLGITGSGNNIATRALAHLGIDLAKVRGSVEFIIGRGDRLVLGQTNLTPRAKKVMELAADEARRLQHDYIGAEHILLGLVREGEGIAAGVMESLGVNLTKVRKQVTQQIERDRPNP